MVIVNKTGSLTEQHPGRGARGGRKINDLGDTFEIISEPHDMVAVRKALQDADRLRVGRRGVPPSSKIALDDQARKVFKMIDALETSTTSRTCCTNCSVSDEIVEKFEASPLRRAIAHSVAGLQVEHAFVGAEQMDDAFVLVVRDGMRVRSAGEPMGCAFVWASARWAAHCVRFAADCPLLARYVERSPTGSG